MNSLRGEVAVTLGGREYTMRPTFNCLKRVEAALGMRLVEIVRSLDAPGVTIVATVAAEAIRAGADDDPIARTATVDKVGELVVEAGLVPVATRVAEMLTGALLGGKKPGEEQAAGGSSA